MLGLAIYLLVCIGLVYTITESAVFARVRIAVAVGGTMREVLVYCASCMGFWVGAGGYLVMLAPHPLQAWSPAYAAGAGFALMGVISVVRAFAPDFLPGAYERERDIVQAIRSRRAPDARTDASTDGSE